MDGLTLHKIFSVVLVILLWVPFGLCDDDDGKGKDNGQGGHPGNSGGGNGEGGNKQKGLLPGQCAGTKESWWNHLATKDGDPCRVHGKLIDQGVNTACCAFKVFPAACGPCNLQSYNIAVACLLCSELPGEQVPNQTAVQNARFSPKFSNWTKHGGTGALLPAEFNNIPWVNTPAYEDFFDAGSAVNTNQASFQMQTHMSSSETPNASPTSEIATQTNPAAASSPANNTPKDGSSSKHNAAAIAGGTIAAFVVTALIITAIIIYRRRRRAKLAPSTQFMAVVRPMEAYNFGTSSRQGSDDPLPFTPGAWTQTTMEKEQTTPRLQRDYDAGIYSRTYAYGA